jgi:hypothetical protein
MTTGGPPNYDPRPPKDRRIGGVESNRSGRRTREDEQRNVQNDGSLIRRISGRNEMDRAKVKRYEPYTFESNATQLRWTVLLLVLWVAFSLWLAFADRATANTLTDLKQQGYISAPPTTLSPQTMRDFGDREGLTCVDEADVFIGTPECVELFDVQARYESDKSRGSFLFVGLIAVLLATSFAFGAFSHRASRNILALNNAEQAFSPEKAVMWFFIPIFNLIKPWQVFKELFRGSDADVSKTEQKSWKEKGRVPSIVHVWAVIWLVVFVYNPITIGRLWNSVRENMDEIIVAHQRLVIADILLAVLGIAAILVIVELHKRQETRHAKVGMITVTPPLPVDPLEEALKEGIRRKELENRRARSKRNKSSK